MSLIVGVAVALFLWALDCVTWLFWTHGWLLFGLPVSGLITGWLYHKFADGNEAGNSAIYELIRKALNDDRQPPTETKPIQLASGPLVLVGTLLTHLCGGSAGREGAAIQLAASLARSITRAFGLASIHQATLMQASIAAGFGAVFGTPWTAAIFAIEVVGLRFVTFRNALACLACGLLADRVALLCGTRHTDYWLLLEPVAVVNPQQLMKIGLAGLAIGIVAYLFLQLTSIVAKLQKRIVQQTWARPAFGGAIFVALTCLFGTREYCGLGVDSNPIRPTDSSIVSSFSSDTIDKHDWLGKLVMTSLTLGSGLRGGEATPLFFIGSTLGNSLSALLELPSGLLAGLGFVAMFAAATRTPLACSVMAIELLAVSLDSSITTAIYAAICCCIAVISRRLFELVFSRSVK